MKYKMITCPRLTNFQPQDWEAIRKAFIKAPSFKMQQAWLSCPEPDFMPCEVKIGWDDKGMHLFAHLQDRDIYTTARTDNEYLWDLGDVFEIFISDSEFDSYHEFHIAPNGVRMQLRFLEKDQIFKIRNGQQNLASCLVKEPLFDFEVRVFETFWEVYAKIPLSTIVPRADTLIDRSWRVSFSRYDYSRSSKNPVLSSASPHQILEFHRQEDWPIVKFISSETLSSSSQLASKTGMP